MIIDQRVDGKLVDQFAGQFGATVSPSSRQRFEDMFQGDQTDEFYAGLLAGLAAAQNLIQNGFTDYVAPTVAFVAHKNRQREIV